MKYVIYQSKVYNGDAEYPVTSCDHFDDILGAILRALEIVNEADQDPNLMIIDTDTCNYVEDSEFEPYLS